MKYTILINQKIWFERFQALNIVDLALYDYLVHFSASKKCQNIMHEKETYFWFSWKKVSGDMPILNLKSRQAVFNRFENLVIAQLLKRHPDNGKMAKAFFSFTDISFEYFEGEQKIESVHNGVQVGVHQNIQPCTQTFTHPVHESVHLPVHESVHNNTINDKTIIDETNNESSSVPDEYSLSVKSYFDFFEKLTGVKPAFSGKAGSSMKRIIKHLHNQFPGRRADQALNYIFGEWNKLDAFTQKQTDVSQIEHFFNSIITQIFANPTKGANNTSKIEQAQKELIENAQTKANNEFTSH